jgi:hypothetical protein
MTGQCITIGGGMVFGLMISPMATVLLPRDQEWTRR